MLRFTGWEVLAANIVYAPVRVSDEERQARLNGWVARLRSIESEKPIEVGEYEVSKLSGRNEATEEMNSANPSPRSLDRQLLTLVGWVLICFAAASLGALFMPGQWSLLDVFLGP
jgi:hypothetical protein